MATATEPPFYADEPLALLSTPAFITGNTDTFTLAASHMALSHNSLIRGFNSIYQHAPRIPASDYSDFVQYCLAWHRCIEQHHRHEEDNYFPAVEREIGVKGLLEGVVEEHAIFEAGLAAFKMYLLSLTVDGKSDLVLNPEALIKIMDSFSSALHAHLVAEPQALLALSRFASPGHNIDMVAIERSEGMKAMTPDFVANVLPVFMNNMESVEFEGGRWRGHMGGKRMPVAGIGRWRFLACDAEGKRGRLAA